MKISSQLGGRTGGRFVIYILKAFLLVWIVFTIKDLCFNPETGYADPIFPVDSFIELNDIPNWIIYPPDSHLVVIDAGHGGFDPGTQGYGLQEKDINLDIALRLNRLLEQANINTYMIRQSDEFIDHRLRIETANEMEASLYLSIHCDWYKDSHYKGTQTFYSPENRVSTGALNGQSYANLVQECLIDGLGTMDRGLMGDPTLAVLRRAHMPSVLVEVGFLSNEEDAQNLGKEEFRQKVAEGLAEGIKEALTMMGN